MKFFKWFSGAVFGLTLAALALPAAASQGSLTGIELDDLNSNGQIERAVLSIENSAHTIWNVRGTTGFKVWYGANQLKLTTAFLASAPGANPAKIEIVWDEHDPNLPIDTSAANFQVQYDAQPIGLGVDDGATALPAIPKGDATAQKLTVDKASPILVSSVPVYGELNQLRKDPIVLTFSEPIKTDTFGFTTDPQFLGWSWTFSSDRKIVTVQPANLGYGRQVTFTINPTVTDDAGNPLGYGPYPDPFVFLSTTSDVYGLHSDPILQLSNPYDGAQLPIGTANIVSWWTNASDIATVRISLSRDGYNYSPVFTAPVSDPYPWFPTGPTGSLWMKIEGYRTNGTLVNFSTIGPMTLVQPPAPDPFAVLINPVVSASDTSATITLSLNRPPVSTTMTCNGSTAVSSFTASGLRPVTVALSLTGLQKDAAYACSAALKDALGGALNLTLPSFKASAAVDKTPPKVINGPVVDQFDAAAKTAHVSWTTDKPSIAVVNYGLLLNYGLQVRDDALSTSHSLTLTGLLPGAMHQLRITSLDANGNASVTKDYRFVFLKNGDRVKSAGGSAVYWVLGGKRYVFPNETVYRSWFADFYNVLPIPDAQLASIAIGGNVQMHAGTWLVKITSDPKVYAVEPDGTLRWVRTEAHARAMFGKDWAKHVRDIDVSLFGDYRVGHDLADDEYPEGTMTRTADGSVWRVSGKNIVRQRVTKDGLESNHYAAASADPAALFRPVDENSAAWKRLTTGDSISAHDDRMNVVRLSADGTQTIAP